MKIAALAMVRVIGGLGVAACGSTTEVTESVDASTAPVDPSCTSTSTDVQRSSLPTGTCVEGATCQFHTPGGCEAGLPYGGQPDTWSCACTTGAWRCEVTGGGYGLVPCDGGIPDGSAD